MYCIIYVYLNTTIVAITQWLLACIHDKCTYFPTPDDPMKVHSKFLDQWHSFYSRYGDEFDPSSATLLELGGGPTIHSLISACQHVSRITFSDYADTNRREIQLWKDNDAKCKRNNADYVVNVGHRHTVKGNN